MATFPYLDHPGPLALAHQGGALEQPGNSMAAFGHAVGLGYRYLETDVRVTSDGKVVTIHDDRVDRVSDRAGLVAGMTYDELRRARLWAPDGALSDERVPLLEEVLATWPDVRVNIDAKDDGVAEPLAGLVERLGVIDRVAVGTFSDRRIRRLRRRLGPRLCTVLAPAEVTALRLASLGLPAGRIGGAAAQVPVRKTVAAGISLPVLDRRLVDAARRRGIAVHVWTIDDPAEMRRLLDLGVDGIITDRPTTLRQVLEERGQWVG